MANNTSYFNLDFFLYDYPYIETCFIATNDFELYHVSCDLDDLSFFSEKVPPYSTWLTFFDSIQENYKINQFYSKAYQLYLMTKELKEIVQEKSETELKEYLDYYKSITEYHPYFLMFFFEIYKTINAILKNNISYLTLIDNLLNIFENFFENYKKLFLYVKNVLVDPFQHGLETGTGYNVTRYERILFANQKKSPLFEEIPVFGSTWYDEMTNMAIEAPPEYPCSEVPDAIFVCDIDLDYSLEFPRGIQYFIDNNYYFRQCPICKGYFKSKLPLMISYCSRIYRNNLTCQELGSKAKYKEKMASHPIHIEYSRMYNRIYARIRRKTLAKEDAKLDELKKLHEFYYYEYEKNDPILGKSILKNFITEMNNLYK